VDLEPAKKCRRAAGEGDVGCLLIVDAVRAFILPALNNTAGASIEPQGSATDRAELLIDQPTPIPLGSDT
jgi:hypothetical protein